MPDRDTKAVLRNVGANASRLRKSLGLTQAQVAEVLGCETSYYQKIEYGSAVPSVPMLVRVSKALGVQIGVLFRAAKTKARTKGRPPAKRKARRKREK